jgi:2-octaprenyl-6-methoxyphenol hydroxylase
MADPVRPAVVVVGAGPVGLLTALGVEQLDLDVTVVAAEPPKAAAAERFDGRAIALMYGSKKILDALRLWTAVGGHATPIFGVRVRDEATGATVTYDAAEIADHPFSYGIENRLLRQALLDQVRARPRIRFTAPAEVVALRGTGGTLTLVLSDGRELAGALVVGADGRASTIRRLARIPAERLRYDQTALTFAVRHTAPHDQLVREYLRPGGPLALLPIGPRLCSVTWVERHDVARWLLEADEMTVLDTLRSTIGDVLGELALESEPAAHPLAGHVATRNVAPRTALVGDAAHGLHPIHAQGFNLGVRDVAALLEVIADARAAGREVGGSDCLLAYERLRRADTRFIAGLTDGLNRLFSNDFAPLLAIRGLGLRAVDAIPPLKAMAMRRGMGLSGDLPRLARGEPLI